MNREGQRTFVLLRQLGSGRESGYARAETRDGSVKINLVVQGFGRNAQPYAFAWTQEGLLPLGELNMDARGQGGIVASLNPSDFREMQMLLVARMNGEEVQIPLAGTVGRGGWIDWAQVREAIAEILRPAPAAEPEAQEAPPEGAGEAEPVQEAPETPAAEETAEPESAQTPVQEQAPETAPEEAPVQAESPAQTTTAEPESGDEPSPEAEVDLYDLPAQMDPLAEAEGELQTPLAEEERREIPALLQNAYWPQALWPLHDLFERFEEVDPFPEEENVVYIRVPLGNAYEEMDSYLIGAKVEDGWVVGVGYLLPGEKQETPPAGMAGYEWKDGYWQSWQYVDPKTEQTE